MKYVHMYFLFGQDKCTKSLLSFIFFLPIKPLLPCSSSGQDIGFSFRRQGFDSPTGCHRGGFALVGWFVPWFTGVSNVFEGWIGKLF